MFRNNTFGKRCWNTLSKQSGFGHTHQYQSQIQCQSSHFFSNKAFAPKWEQYKDEKTRLGGLKAIEKQHNKNKLTAKERIDLLCDKGSFREVGSLVTHRCTDFGMENKTV